MEKNLSAFTLIEVSLVIAMVSILSTIAFVGLDPFGRLQDSRNLKRSGDINSILIAIHQYIVDNKGALPTGLSTGMNEAQLGTNTSGCAISTGGCNVATDSCLNLSSPLSTYLSSIPYDKYADAFATGYSIKVNSNNIVTVRACLAEAGESISISK